MPAWSRTLLLAAAVYNGLWGLWVIVFPNALFNLLGMTPPMYPGIWQCVGMIVGVYGVGYAIAAFDPARHWPIVLVGLLGKILGPVGFVIAATGGELPWSFGLTVIANDLIWWAPFGAILWAAAQSAPASADAGTPSIDEALATTVDGGAGAGQTIADLSGEQAMLIVFLRHSGCTFCREALADIARQRHSIESAGTRIALVHMTTDDLARAFASDYGLEDLARIADPDQRLYRAFGLKRGTLGQLFGPFVAWRGVQAAILERHGIGALQGDGMQMPGLFLVRDGRVVSAVRHRTAADRPNYAAVACSA